MTELKTKTIGLSFETWKKLKIYTVERDCTFSEAVDVLLVAAKRRDEVPRTKQDAAG
jgi:macrodomain Ter protein organizer (MatP/YcbG family)